MAKSDLIRERDGFSYTGTFVAWQSHNRVMVAPLYGVSPETAKWDGTDATHAIGVRLTDPDPYPKYSYVGYRETGKTLTYLPGLGCSAYRCRITLGIGTPEEETISAWRYEVPHGSK